MITLLKNCNCFYITDISLSSLIVFTTILRRYIHICKTIIAAQ